MQINFPPPPPGQTGSYLSKLLTVLKQAFSTVVSSQTAAPRVILRSPGGNNYSVTAADNGALTVSNALATTPNTAGQATMPLLASTLKVVDDTDKTKAVEFAVSGVSTATTRTLTVQDKDGTIALSADVSAAQSAAVATAEAYTDTKGRRILQVASTETGTSASGTTLVPADNTIPQNTEGDQYMSFSFTPLSASSTLLIEVVGHFSTSAASSNAIMSLFRDSVANALATAMQYIAVTNAIVNVNLQHEMASPGTSAITFKVRCGSNVAGTTYFNGNGSGQLFGGVFCSGIKITEYL